MELTRDYQRQIDLIRHQRGGAGIAEEEGREAEGAAASSAVRPRQKGN